MFWLVHVHDGPSSFTGWSFAASMDWRSRVHNVDGRKFAVMPWFGRSSQFIEKWKRATAHVFFECQGRLYFLAGDTLARRMTGGVPLKKGEYALSPLTREEFIRAVRCEG